MGRMAVIDAADLRVRCEAAALAAGADATSAAVLADATVEAELAGNRAVGVGHLFDYLDGYQQGRIASDATPTVHRPASAVVTVDARKGLAQNAFLAGYQELQDAVREAGVAAIWIRDSFTCGELGWYVRHAARHGLIAVAAANSPALMSIGGARTRVLGTNPLAFGLPRSGRQPVVIDQASSATAFVNIRRAAQAGEPIPDGWALDADGHPTTDAAAALAGVLLPFGLHRGGNIALLVEVLATLSGGAFSVDAAPFDSGDASPGIGVVLFALDPTIFGAAVQRLDDHLQRLGAEHQVRLPALAADRPGTEIELEEIVLQRLTAAAEV